MFQRAVLTLFKPLFKKAFKTICYYVYKVFVNAIMHVATVRTRARERKVLNA